MFLPQFLSYHVSFSSMVQKSSGHAWLVGERESRLSRDGRDEVEFGVTDH